jgi:hypothetical protein
VPQEIICWITIAIATAKRVNPERIITAHFWSDQLDRKPFDLFNIFANSGEKTNFLL